MSRGRSGFIGIGFVEANFPVDRLPGWEARTYGYHGDDGKAFNNTTVGWNYGPKYGTGDRIGVIFNRAERTIAYYKNGISLGVAFRDVQEEVLYPAVGLRTPGEEVLANFGAQPFQGDVAAMRAEAVYRLEQRVLQTPLPCKKAQDTSALVGTLIFNHMALNGHWCTAAAVARDLLGSSVAVAAEDVQDFSARGCVRECIMRGDIDAALVHAQAYMPGSLTSCQPILFRMQCQKLVELVRAKDDQAALAHGKAELGGPLPEKEQRDLLSDALTLLCYEDPAASPQGALMVPAARATLADDVDAVLLAARQRPQQSVLEQLYCSLSVLRAELEASAHPAASLLDFDGLLSLKRPQ